MTDAAYEAVHTNRYQKTLYEDNVKDLNTIIKSARGVKKEPLQAYGKGGEGGKHGGRK